MFHNNSDLTFFSLMSEKARKKRPYEVYYYEVLSLIMFRLNADKVAYFRYEKSKNTFYLLSEIMFPSVKRSFDEKNHKNLVPVEQLIDDEWNVATAEMKAEFGFDLYYPFFIKGKEREPYLTLIAISFQYKETMQELLKEREILRQVGKFAMDVIVLKHAYGVYLFGSKEKRYLTDDLTGVFKRRCFDDDIETQIKSGLRFVLVFCDIDNFKSINDAYGHLTGDRVIMAVAEALCDEQLKNPVVYRFGGEEFVIIFKIFDGDDVQIKNYLKRARRRISKIDILKDREVTVSFGYVFWHQGIDKNVLINAADLAMYWVKKNGRNGVKKVVITEDIQKQLLPLLQEEKTEETERKKMKILFQDE